MVELELATLFDYKIDKNDQDWTYTIVESEKIDDYIEAYGTSIINEAAEFSLMEMIIQSLDDQPAELVEEKWIKVRALSRKDFKLGI